LIRRSDDFLVSCASHLQAGQGGHRLVGEHAPALAVFVFPQFLHGICLDADGLALVHVVQAVAVGHGAVRNDVEIVAAHAHYGTQFHAHVLGRIEGADGLLAALGKIIGVAAVEVLVDVRGEQHARAPARRARQLRTALHDLVQQQAVMGGDVLHVAHVLVTALDLERAHAGIDQGFQVAALVVVLHRQQVLFVSHHAALAVGQGVRQAARLRAVAAVGAAAVVGVRDVALAREGHAQGAVDEVFERRVDLRADRLDLLDGEFARQHQLAEADLTQEFRLFRGADVALGTGVHLDRRQIEFEQAHVLDDQGVDAGFVQLPDLLSRRLQLGVVHDRVHGHEDARTVAVREFDQRRDVGQRVAGVVARAEGGTADVDRVRPVQDRLAADLGGFGGGQQFELVGEQ